MNCIYPIVVLYLTVLIAGSAQETQNTLKFAQVIFRHGIRNPEHPYGKYLDISRYWPEGVGELTNQGKQQTYSLGKFLRTTYDGFISADFKPSQVRILSSSKTRAINSASHCLFGFFKRYHDQASWVLGSEESIFPYEPIPIRTIPLELDNVIALEAKCPRKQEIIEEERPEFEFEYFKDDWQMFQYIANKSGHPVLQNTDASHLDIHVAFTEIMETQLALYQQGRELEIWMRPLVSEPKFLSYYYYLIRSQNGRDEEAQRLNAGPLLHLLLTNFAKFLRGESPEKMILISGHDKTLLNIFWTVGISQVLENHIPPYSASLQVELHQKQEEEPFIEFWYYNGSENFRQLLVPPACGNPCRLSTLTNITSTFANVNFDEDCRVEPSQ